MTLGSSVFMLGNNNKPKVSIYSFLVRAKPSPNSSWKFLPP